MAEFDPTADALERRIVAAAVQIQNQFVALTKAIDERVDANKEQSDAKFTALEHLLHVRTDGLEALFNTSAKGGRDLSDERLSHLQNILNERLSSTNALLNAKCEDINVRLSEFRALVDTWFASRDKALALQADEYERRLDLLNHERTRLDAIGMTYVRNDLYAKDMERIYNERKEQMLATENARAAQELAAMQNRRTTGLTLFSVVVSVVLSIGLHYMH
jgi:hypothetical protein